MNISLNSRSVLFARGNKLKSTEEKEERQQKAQSQIDFFENQKANLKNMKCETLEEISQKLELFNNYDAQIMSVKQQYNQEQMMHTMDEARELGEKIAEAAEDLEPKTADERREEIAKEALGVEDEGILDEMLDELPEETLEETLEDMLQDDQTMKEALEEELPEVLEQEKLTEMYLDRQYVPFDTKA